MDYKLGITRNIHWDEEGLYKIHRNCIIQWLTTSEVGDKLHKEKLLINIVAKPTILDKKLVLFSSIFHTKAILSFKKDEDPITDIIKMWEDCFLQEKQLFTELGKGTNAEYIDFNLMGYLPFDSAYNLREVLLQLNLVRLP